MFRLGMGIGLISATPSFLVTIGADPCRIILDGKLGNVVVVLVVAEAKAIIDVLACVIWVTWVVAECQIPSRSEH